MRKIVASDALEGAVLDLVGDLAAYNPGAKLVIFEGSEDAEFDVKMTSDLFPDFSTKCNCVSGTNKHRVKGLYDILHRLSLADQLPYEVFAIVDGDAMMSTPVGAFELAWPVYHIENFLLDAEFVGIALGDILGRTVTAVQAENLMLEAARDSVAEVAVHRAISVVNESLVKCLNVGAEKDRSKAASALQVSVSNSVNRLNQLVGENYSSDHLKSLVEKHFADCDTYFFDGSWRSRLPGRSILKRVVQLADPKAGNYFVLRNIILARMRDRGHQPQGMKQVLRQISEF